MSAFCVFGMSRTTAKRIAEAAVNRMPPQKGVGPKTDGVRRSRKRRSR